MDLITHDPGGYHVSLDTLWEFEKTILADSHVRNWNQKYNLLPLVPNVIWRRLYYLLEFLASRQPASPKLKLKRIAARDLFAVLMGPNTRKTMPRFLLEARKSIYLFDAWPSTHQKIKLFANACRLDHIFLSSSQATQRLAKTLPYTTCHWIPEGINPENYGYSSLASKDIDVLQLGRRYDRYHEMIAGSLETSGKKYLYEKNRGQIVFTTRDAFLHGLARAKISTCVPATLTHPDQAGGIETMTVRYLQSMLSKCLIVGHAPEEMIELFGYNPVIEIDYNDPAGQLQSILANMTDYVQLIEKNYTAVLENHTWKHRWHKIAEILSNDLVK